MIALAFFAGIFLTATVAILIVRGAKAPHVDEIDWRDCCAGLPLPMPRVKPARDAHSTYINRCDKCHTEKPFFWPCEVCREKDRYVLGDDDRMRSLSVRTPEREHCINCGLNVDPWCCCARGRELASKIEANAISARDADFWDIANHEPEASRVEYRFLGITGFEDD